MLDADLAKLYGVGAKRLNEAVRRNVDRFPNDFMFRLTSEEFEVLRSQIVTSSWGGRRYLPYAFTEYGALMAANVIDSAQAIEMSVHVIRAFVQMRRMLVAHKGLTRQLSALEAKIGRRDDQFQVIIEANPPQS